MLAHLSDTGTATPAPCCRLLGFVRLSCVHVLCSVEATALTIDEGAVISEGVVLQGHTVERLAATFVPTE